MINGGQKCLSCTVGVLMMSLTWPTLELGCRGSRALGLGFSILVSVFVVLYLSVCKKQERAGRLNCTDNALPLGAMLLMCNIVCFSL